MSIVRYLHALDTLYEDQQQELKKWSTKAKEAEAEVQSLKLELLLTKSQLATMRGKKAYYQQELMNTLKHPRHKKCSRRMDKGKRTFAMPPEDKVEILEKGSTG